MHHLRSAQNLRSVPTARSLIASPSSFDGTLDELFDRFIARNLPQPDDVADLHRALRAYVKRPDPLFLLRQMSGAMRRATYTTRTGGRFKATDNAPAWWTYTAMLQGARVASDAIAEVIATMPAHMFDSPPTSATSAAQRGWHLANIFPVKDRTVDYRDYTRRELTARFIRNVHPCNYFLIPKPGWQRWSADPGVVAFFVEQYERRYADVWDEFVAVAGTDAPELVRTSEPVRYAFGPGVELPRLEAMSF